MPKTPDQLKAIALDLASRVKDDDPEANARWLAAMVPDPADQWRLHFVQAALTPDDVPESQLLGWMEHGSPAAAARHEARGERMCPACLEWANEPVSALPTLSTVSTGLSTKHTAPAA